MYTLQFNNYILGTYPTETHKVRKSKQRDGNYNIISCH